MEKKKHVPGIWMSIKIAQKWCILHAKSSSCSPWKITTFELSRYTDEAKKSNKKSVIFNIKINVFLRAKSLFSSFPVYGCRQKTCTKLSFFIENSSFFTQKSLFFSKKNQWFHTSRCIDDHEKTCKKSLHFCSNFTFFDSKSSFLLFPVYRWTAKCCKIVHFHRKFVEEFVIFRTKNHVFTNACM